MRKIGRNESCPCGSGKKYKKCCANNPINSKTTSDNSNLATSANRNHENKELLITTLTNELHMPVRLYYEVYDRAALIQAFNQLRCITQRKENFWALLYDDEAKKFGLSVQYHQIEKSRRPIVLGYCYLVNNQQLYIDVRSFKRAVCMVEFIDRHISRECMRVTHSASCNEVMTAAAGTSQNITPQDISALFAPNNIIETKPEELICELVDKVTAQDSEEDRTRIAFEQMRAIAQRPKKQTEKSPLYFYAEGISAFEFFLKTKEIIAMKHYDSSKPLPVLDFLSKIADKLNKLDATVTQHEQQTETERAINKTTLEPSSIQS